MRVQWVVPVIVSILIIGAIYSNQAFAAPIIIDDFDDAFQFLQTSGGPFIVNSIFAATGVIGGERDVLLNGISGLNTVVVGPPTGVLSFSEDTLSDGELRLLYDGGASTGLGGIDLTDGGTNDRFVLRYVSTDFNSGLTIDIVDTIGSRSTATFGVPGSTVNTSFFIPFSNFVPVVGAGADFSDIDSIELFLESSSSGTNIVIDFIEVRSLDSDLQNQIDVLQDIIDNNPGTDLADIIQDALDAAQDVLDELNETPPDNADAVGSIEDVVDELQDAIDDGLLDDTEGTQIMDQFTGIARQIAVAAIADAIDQGGDADDITEAEDLLAEGDAFRASGAFEDAVDSYEDAVENAEDALP